MPDPTKAEAGEQIHYRIGDGQLQLTTTIGPPCTDKTGGFWFCVTHDQPFQHNFDKDLHIQKRTCRLAWVCFQHGPEAP